MSKYFNEFTEKTAAESGNYVVGYDQVASGGEKKYKLSTIANTVSALMVPSLSGDAWLTSTGSLCARSLANRFADVVNVKDFGAVGDGVADDRDAIQNALNSGADVVMFPSGIYKWGVGKNGPTIRSNTIVIGDGAIIVQPNSDITATISNGIEYVGFRIDCGSQNIVIDGFDIRGPYYLTTPTPSYRSIGINISGRYDQYFYNNPNYPSNPSTPVAGTSQKIIIKNNQFNGWGQSAVIADQIDQLFCYNNRFVNCTRDGLRMYGVKYFNVHDNYVREMAPGFPSEGTGPNFNVYGITATRIYHSTLANGTTTDYRPSSQGLISNNIIRDCPTWKALDTHGGTHITFSNNIIENAHIGIGIDKGGYNTADGYAPPRNIKIIGNTITADPTNTAGNRCGIFCVAHDDTVNNIGEDLIISNNQITGFGEDTRDGNIVISNYNRGTISNNIITGGLRCGINFQQTIKNFVVNGGVISNIAKTSLNFLAGISSQTTTQQVSIDNISFIKDDTSDVMQAISTAGTPSAGYGVKLGNNIRSTGNVTIISSPVHLLQDSAYITRVIAFGNINNNGTSASILNGRGISSVTRDSIGTVTVVLLETLLTSCNPIVSAKGSNTLCFVNAITTNSFTIETRNASTNASIDAGFIFQVNGY